MEQQLGLGLGEEGETTPAIPLTREIQETLVTLMANTLLTLLDSEHGDESRGGQDDEG